jgi:hypothetical protein
MHVCILFKWQIKQMDMSNLSYKQQQYFERHQDKILAKCYNT